MSKRVLITGGSRGIGKAIAECFTKNGYTVVTPVRDELDLLSNESIAFFIKNNQEEGFDIIINNAGINPIDEIENIKEKDFNDTMQVNITAPFKLIQGFVGKMKKENFGRIVNISSIWGLVSKEKRLTYSITKNGINGITKTLAVELGGNNILVNSICPGYINTELTKKNVSEVDAKKIQENIPLRRFAEPEEVAELVYFLCSEKNSYITGQIIAIDGGYTSK